LKKAILEEILKTDVPNRNFYVKSLNETIDQLILGFVEKGYPCCYVGCRYLGEKHSNYVRHLKVSHPNKSFVTLEKNAIVVLLELKI